MLYMLIGCGIALFVTFVVASFFGFGAVPRSDTYGFYLAFRLIAEAILVAGFIGGLVAVAVLQNVHGWQMLGGYALLRVCALVIETSRR
jgi:hypothetical protein